MKPTQHKTRVGVKRRRVYHSNTPMHPIEETAQFRRFLSKYSGSRTIVSNLRRMLRSLRACSAAELTPYDVDCGVQLLMEEDYNPNSIVKYRAALITFFRFLADEGLYTGKNVAKLSRSVDISSVDAFLPYTVNDDDRQLLHEHFTRPDASHEERFFWFSLRGGCRLCEPAMALVRDIKTISENGQDIPRCQFGSKRKRRVVDMPLAVLPDLNALVAAADGDLETPLLELNCPATEEFKNRRTSLLRYWFDSIQIQVLGEARYTPKMFRSDYITRALRLGGERDIEYIAQRVGNSPDIIRQHYAHLLDKRSRELAEV